MKLKGSMTIELAYMMPIVFLTMITSFYIMFHFHDKNILIGAAYETAVVGVQKTQWDDESAEEKMKELFQERIRGKFIFYSHATLEINRDEKAVVVKANARKGKMKICAEQKISLVRPEKEIRDYRRIKNIWKQDTKED